MSAPVRALLEATRSPHADVTPLIGRERELAQLHGALARVQRAGRAELVTLVGEPGIGKSRLVRELAAQRRRADAQVLDRTLPGLRRRGHLLAAARDGAPGAARAHADGGHGRRPRRARRRRRRSQPRLGLGGPGSAEAAPWAFRMLFTNARGALGPLVLAFEDAHWAEPALLDVIDQLAGRPMTAPVLLLCVGRPELLAARPAWARGCGAASGAAGRERQPPTARCPATAAHRCARAGGRAGPRQPAVPRAAVGPRARAQPGRLAPARAACTADRAPRHTRPDRAPDHRGGRDRGGDLPRRRAWRPSSRAPSAPGCRLRSSCCSRRELVRPAFPFIAGQRAFRFGHALVRDAAYAACRWRRGRARTSGWPRGSWTWARRFPRRAHGSAPSSSAPTGPRASCACPLRASTRSRTAPRGGWPRRREEVHRRGDLPSEIAFLERALALLAPGDGVRAELLPALGVGAVRGRQPGPGGQGGRRGGRRRSRSRAPARRGRARAHARLPPSRVRRSRRVADVAELAAAALEELGDDVGVATGALPDVRARLAAGRVGARRCATRARSCGWRAEPAPPSSSMRASASSPWALVVNRVPVSAARAECDELLRLVAGRRFAELGVRGFAAVLDAMAGDFEQARTQLARSRDGLNELGLHQASIWMAMFDAQAELLAGDPAAAKAALYDAERVADEIGDRWFHSTILVDRAHVLLAQDARRATPPRRSPASRRSRPRTTPNGASSVTRRGASSPLAKATPSARWRRPAPRSRWPSRPRCSCSAPMPGAIWPRSPGAWAGRRRPRRRARRRSPLSGQGQRGRRRSALRGRPRGGAAEHVEGARDPDDQRRSGASTSSSNCSRCPSKPAGSATSGSRGAEAGPQQADGGEQRPPGRQRSAPPAPGLRRAPGTDARGSGRRWRSATNAGKINR